MEQKKSVIIQEILYWQKNHLLPDHYCQFLLNLYCEGEGAEETNSSQRSKKVSWKMGLLSLLISFVLLGLFMLVTQFQSFPLYVQGAILGFFSLFLYIGTYIMRLRNSDRYHLTLGVASLSLLFTTLWVSQGLDLKANTVFLTLVVVLILWLVSGILFQAHYVVLITIVGFMLSYGWYIHPWIVAQNSVFAQHLIWYPFAITGIVIGLLLLKKDQFLGRLFYFSSLSSLFASNIHSFLMDQISLLSQILFLFVEISIVTILLFFTQNHLRR